MRIRLILLSGFAAALACGCGGGGGGNGGNGGPAAGAVAFAITTDFSTGSFGTVSLDDPSQITPASATRRVHSDAVPRVFGDLVYVVNRIFADNIQILDPRRDFETVVQCSTGNGSNPHDIVVVGDHKAYVTLYDAGQVLVVDPSPSPDCSDFELDRIDLSAFGDDDGNPEPDQMAVVDGILYVSLQRLDRDNFFVPAERGGIVLIDVDSDEVLSEVTMSGSNPFAATKGLLVDDGALIVGETGSFGVADGGIERIDLESNTASGFFVTEADLGGDINDFIVDGDVGFAVVSGADFSNTVVQFDPATGTVTRTLLAGVPFISDIELDGRGALYMADRTLTAPGIRIFDVTSGEELTMGAINLGLPPFEIVFVP